MREKRLESIDRFRVFAAALVVAIHTSPLTSYSLEADFFLTRVFARIAVPFFFMVTGQFVVSALPKQGAVRAVRYVKKIALLYGISILCYVPIGLYAGQYEKLGIADVLRLAVFDGTFYHLWYFPACITGVLLVLGLYALPGGRRGGTAGIVQPWMFAVAIGLYAVGLFGDSYYGLAAQVPMMARFYQMLFRIFSYTRNGIFMAPVFLLLGAVLTKRRVTQVRVLWAGFLLSFLAMTAEAYCLRYFKLQRHDSMYVFLVPVMYFFYQLLLEGALYRGKRKWKQLGFFSTCIYIVHPACILVVRAAARITKCERLTENSLVHYAAVLACSVVCSLAFVWCRQVFDRNGRIWRGQEADAGRRDPGNSYRIKDPGKEEHMGSIKEHMGSIKDQIEITKEPMQITSIEQKERHALTENPDAANRAAADEPYALAAGQEHALFPQNPVMPRGQGRDLREQETEKDGRARAWVELDYSALKGNVDMLRSILPPYCKLMPALKADAYGHGALQMAEALQEMGVDAFCVACVKEGILLRSYGIRGEILVLGYTHPQEFALLLQYDLTQTVVDYAYALQLNSYGADFPVHIGIDTGMHRLGERSENLERVAAMFQMEHLRIDGIFTHLCASDTLDPCSRAYTEAQVQAFCTLLRGLEEKGIACPKVHMQASYGVLHYPHLAGDYARVGIALYGVLSTKEDTARFREKLRPVLSLKARVAAVKTLHAGESAGYGMQFYAEEEMQLAVLTIGYADGLPRALSGGVGSVLIHGRKARVVGCVCMDQTLVDISGIEDVRAGDTAVCIGRDGAQEISAADLAQQAGTITNEILSRLGARLERVMV